MKVWITRTPERAVRYLAGKFRHVVVRRERFYRPVVWFRPNLLSDLNCWWHWDNPRKHSQREVWQEEGGILMHYPYRNALAWGEECGGHYSEQMPLTLARYAIHTAQCNGEAVIPMPLNWEHLRERTRSLHPTRALVERVYSQFDKLLVGNPSEYQIAAAKEAGANPLTSVFLTGETLANLTGTTEFGGIRRALFPQMQIYVSHPVKLMFRPPDEGTAMTAYRWMEKLPMFSGGIRLVRCERMSRETRQGLRELFEMKKAGYVLVQAAIYVFDLETIRPDFGVIEESSLEFARRLEGMIRFAESLPELRL